MDFLLFASRSIYRLFQFSWGRILYSIWPKIIEGEAKLTLDIRAWDYGKPVSLKKTAEILVKLNTLKEMGVRIAVDDFGKGILVVKSFEIGAFWQNRKIDKEITDNIDVDNKAVSNL